MGTTATKNLRVAGVTFRPGYPKNLHRLREIIEADQIDEIRGDLIEPASPIEVLLVREPDNQYDPNAVQVHLPILGREGFVGFIPATTAIKLAPKLDAGLEVEAAVVGVWVTDHAPEKPGLEIQLAVTAPAPHPTPVGAEEN